jgi:NDP-sugar pyrophosphorylase family protein
LDGIAVLHIMLLQLREAGYRRVTLSLGYKASLFRDYFGDGRWLNLELDYSLESKPLGTAGPLSLIASFDDSTLVANADLLTNVDFSDVWIQHQKSGAMATMVLCRHTVEINYGVIEMDDRQRITSLREKPRIEYLISGGIYVLEPSVPSYLSTGVYTDMPTLLAAIQEDGQPISGYVFDGDWFDIGTPEQLRLAEKAFRANRSRYLSPTCPGQQRPSIVSSSSTSRQADRA